MKTILIRLNTSKKSVGNWIDKYTRTRTIAKHSIAKGRNILR
jgi:transposase